MKITLVQPKYFNIWESLGLAYIGSQALVDLATQWKHGKTR